MKIRALFLAFLVGLAACDAGTTAPQASAPPSAAPDVSPTFTDVRVGDTVSTVRMETFKTGKNRAVVVEPVIFMKNPDFCRAFKIARDEKTCALPFGIEYSGARITVPRTDAATYALIDAKRWRECTDTDLVAAVCEVTAAQFQKWILREQNGVVLMTTENGTATRFAQIYIPDSYDN